MSECNAGVLLLTKEDDGEGGCVRKLNSTGLQSVDVELTRCARGLWHFSTSMVCVHHRKHGRRIRVVKAPNAQGTQFIIFSCPPASWTPLLDRLSCFADRKIHVPLTEKTRPYSLQHCHGRGLHPRKYYDTIIGSMHPLSHPTSIPHSSGFARIHAGSSSAIQDAD